MANGPTGRLPTTHDTWKTESRARCKNTEPIITQQTLKQTSKQTPDKDTAKSSGIRADSRGVLAAAIASCCLFFVPFLRLAAHYWSNHSSKMPLS
jgi:hypothetical protein